MTQHSNNDFDNFSHVMNNEEHFVTGGRSLIVNNEFHHQTMNFITKQ